MWCASIGRHMCGGPPTSAVLPPRRGRLCVCGVGGGVVRRQCDIGAAGGCCEASDVPAAGAREGDAVARGTTNVCRGAHCNCGN